MKSKSLIWGVLLLICDLFLIVVADVAALFVYTDFFTILSSASVNLKGMMRFMPLQMVVTAAVYYLRRMYHYLWRSLSLRDVLGMVFSVTLAYVAASLLSVVLDIGLAPSFRVFMFLTQLFLHVCMRCALRVYTALRQSAKQTSKMERIMLIGAGDAGRMLLHEIQTSNKIRGKVCCLIDDNSNKWGKYLEGVRIYGGRERIPALAEREHITQIIFAIPSCPVFWKQREITDLR